MDTAPARLVNYSRNRLRQQETHPLPGEFSPARLFYFLQGLPSVCVYPYRVVKAKGKILLPAQHVSYLKDRHDLIPEVQFPPQMGDVHIGGAAVHRD